MNEAIKLAIEKGGYKDGFKDERMTVQNGQLFTFGPRFHKDELENMLVLDPLFWQALGKALGWIENEYARCGSLDCVHNDEYLPTWLYYALQYHELVLTGGDTEKFWKELLRA